MVKFPLTKTEYSDKMIIIIEYSNYFKDFLKIISLFLLDF